MNNIAIIPARSGSKGLKNKNIKEMCGKPMMAYSIEAALNSNMFDRVVVSTDSEEYASIARTYGAEVPFLRSDLLSGDGVGSWDVVKDVLNKIYTIEKQIYDTVTLLQPTSPLRMSSDIVAGYNLMREKNANAVIAVCEMEHSPLWASVLRKDNNMKGFVSAKYLHMPRQQLEKFYRINGALYILTMDSLKDVERLYDNKCYAYIMERENSVDIDEEVDFLIAEYYMKKRINA